jgi:hypothetical protein
MIAGYVKDQGLVTHITDTDLAKLKQRALTLAREYVDKKLDFHLFVVDTQHRAIAAGERPESYMEIFTEAGMVGLGPAGRPI